MRVRERRCWTHDQLMKERLDVFEGVVIHNGDSGAVERSACLA